MLFVPETVWELDCMAEYAKKGLMAAEKNGKSFRSFPASHPLNDMDEEQQITQEPVQEPAPEKQPDTTQATITGVSPLVALLLVGPIGVNIVAPLICWLIWKNENPLVDRLGKNILNAQISWTIYTLVCILLWPFLIGIPLLIIVGIAWIVLSIITAVKIANRDYNYVMPLTITFLK